MSNQTETTMRDALMALHTIIPALLNIIARQDPRQRSELESALTYAINRCGDALTATETQGVANILTTWKDSLDLATRTRLDS